MTLRSWGIHTAANEQHQLFAGTRHTVAGFNCIIAQPLQRSLESSLQATLRIGLIDNIDKLGAPRCASAAGLASTSMRRYSEMAVGADSV
jgi:hypothetical protein